MALGKPRKILPRAATGQCIASPGAGSSSALDAPAHRGAAARLLERDAERGVAAALRPDDLALHRAAVAPGAEAGELARRRASRLGVVEGAVGLERGPRTRRPRRQRHAGAAAVAAVEVELDRAEHL